MTKLSKKRSQQKDQQIINKTSQHGANIDPKNRRKQKRFENVSGKRIRFLINF